MIRYIFIALLLSSPVFAQQQQPEATDLKRVINALYQQRNSAMDQQLNAEVKAAATADELTKAQARIKELEAKLTPDEQK